MPLNPHKRSVFVACEALLIPDFFEKKLIVRCMGVVTGQTFPLFHCCVDMRYLANIEGHLGMADITELVLLPEFQG
jgi:hypothetical protein